MGEANKEKLMDGAPTPETNKPAENIAVPEVPKTEEAPVLPPAEVPATGKKKGEYPVEGQREGFWA